MHQDHSSVSATDSTHHAHTFFDKLSFRGLAVTILLAPLFFIPTPYLTQDVFKSAVISQGVIFSAFCLVMIAKKRGHLELLPKNIMFSLGSLATVVILSSLMSGHISKSLFGQGFEFTTASFILVLLAALYVTSIVVREHVSKVQYVYGAIVAPYVLIAIFHWIRILGLLLIGKDVLVTSFLPSITSTLVGTWYSFGMYSVAIIVVALVSIVFTRPSKRLKIAYYVLAAIAFASACVVQYVVAWQAGALVVGVLTIYGYLKGTSHTSVSAPSLSKRVPWPLLIATILFLVFSWQGSTVLGPVVQAFRTQYSEIILPWRYTLDIATETTKADMLLGSGPNSFSQAYISHKPLEINATPVWDAEFSVGFSIISTLVATQGVLGIVVWAIFLIVLGMCMMRIVRRMPTDPTHRYVSILSISLVVFFWVMNVLALPSLPLLFYSFVVTGIMIGVATSYGILPARTYSIEAHNKTRLKKKITVAIPYILIAVCIVWALMSIKKMIAFSYFGAGVQELTVSGNVDQAYDAFQKALMFDGSDIYRRAEVESLIAKAALLARGDASAVGSSTPDQVNVRIIGTINDALNAAKKAIAYDEQNYYNYASEARVFEFAASLKMKDAANGAITSYTKAAELNQRNPALYLNLARFQASQGSYDDALKSAGTALKLKQNYLDAIFLVSQIYVVKGSIADALTATRVATEIEPSNPLVWFQYGFLFYNNKEYARANEMLSKALAIQPDYANAQYFLGLSLAYQNKRPEAIKQFEQLSTTNPSNQEVSLILKNLRAGRDPFEDAPAPVSTKPEKRSSPPLKEDQS